MHLRINHSVALTTHANSDEQFWRLAVKAEHEARQAFDDSFRSLIATVEDSKRHGRLSAASQDALDYTR